MAYKCVCFDFDGTLADTQEIVFELYNAMAEKYHYRTITREEMIRIKEMTIPEILSVIKIPIRRIPKMIREGQRRMREHGEKIMAFQDDLSVFAAELSKEVFSMGIITSNSSKTVRAFLDRQFARPYFDFISSTSMFTKDRKLKRICRKLKIKPCELLYIGDETRDVIACHRAGVDIAAVSWGYNTRQALIKCRPTYMIDDLWDIIDIVKTMNQNESHEIPGVITK